MTVYNEATVDHVPGLRRPGRAAYMVLTSDHFDRAQAEISAWEGYSPTPVEDLGSLAGCLGVAAVSYKHEGPRFGLRSFKALGAPFAAACVMQAELERRLGHPVSLQDVRACAFPEAAAQITLASATDGNHGRALAWGAARFGAACKIYIHAEVSAGREQAMRDLGADVIRVDGDYDYSVRVTREDAEANGWFVVSDTSWPGYTEPPRDVMAGYGVLIREAASQLDRVPTHIFIQGGVGGLAAGVAAAAVQAWRMSPPRIVVVEPDRAACLYASAAAGTATTVPIEEETIMAGLSCGEPSGLAWQVLEQAADDFITIPDAIVAPTVRMLALGDPKIEAGESAVCGLAGLICAASRPSLRDALKLEAGSRILLIGSEGVTDPAIFARIMDGHDD